MVCDPLIVPTPLQSSTRQLLKRGTGVPISVSAKPLKYAPAVQRPTVLVAVCLSIEDPQCFHDIVKADC